MPLGFKLRKPHMSYDVLSKNLFGVTVELLDNSQLECSLNTDSTGQDCVEHVCQRLGIEEADYFGMRFVNTRLQYQWLDPDQPVKVQLERHAQDPTLYFAVQFYVQSIYQVQDEMARHQVYLQLRHDVIEGKLVAQPGIAIMLAAYMLQATRGDYDPQQQTIDLLRNELLLPNNMMLAGGSNSNNNENTTTQQLLLRNVAEAHEQLRGMPPALAKLYYIVEAQKLEGYGDESFAAKDASGNDLLLAHNLSGIYIFRIPHSRPFLTMRWHDLKAVGQNKKAIGLECVGSGRASSRMMCVYMEDVESARYLAKMIELQKEFRTAMAEIEQQQQQTEAAPNQPQTNNNSEQQQHHNQRMQQQRDDQQTNMPNANALSPSSNLLLATGASSSSTSQAAAAVGAAQHQQRYNQQQQQYYSHYPGGTSSAGGASALLLNGNNNFDANRFSSGGTYTENQQYFIGSNFYPTPPHHQQQFSSVSNAPPTLHARQQQQQQQSNLYSGSVLGGPPNRAELYANVSAPPAFSNKNNNNIDAVVGGTAIYRPNQNFQQQQQFYQSYDNQALQQQQQQQQQVVAANRPAPSNSGNVKPAKRTETNSSSNSNAHQQHTSSKNYHIPANNNTVTAAHSSHAQNNQHTDELQHAGLTHFTANGAKVLRAQRQPHYSSSDQQKLQQTQQQTSSSSTAASSSSTSTPTPASYVYQQAHAAVAENDENDDPLVHYFDQQHVDVEVIVSAQDGKNLPQPRQKSSVDSTSSSETNFGGSIASSSSSAESSSSSKKKPKNVVEPNFNVNFAPPKPSKTTTPSPSKQPARNANAPSVNYTPSKRSRTPPGEQTTVAEQQQQQVVVVACNKFSVDAAICDAVSTEIAAAVTTNDPYYYYEDYTDHQPNNEGFQISAVDAQQHHGSDSRALNDVADYFAPIPIGDNLFQQQFHAPVSPPFAELKSQCLAYTASSNSDTPNMLADGGFVVNHVSSSKNNNAAASSSASRLKQPRNVVPRAVDSRATSKSQPHGRANGGGGPSTTVSNGHVNANFDDDDNLLWSVADDAAGQLPHHQSSDDDMMALTSRRPRHENFAVVEHNSAAATNHRKPQQHNTRSQPKTEFDDVVDSFYSSHPIVTAPPATVVTTSTTDRPTNPKSKIKPTPVVDTLTPVQSTEQLLVDNNAEQFVVMKSSARSSSQIKQPPTSAGGAAAIKPSREIVRSDLPAPAAEEEAAELFASRAALPPQSKKRISADSLDDTVVAQKPPASYTQTSSTVSTQSASISPPTVEPDNDDQSYYPQRSIGPMQLAEMTGLTLSRMRLRDVMPNIDKNSNDAAIAQLLLLDAEHTHQMSQSATALLSNSSSSSKRPGSSTLTRSSRRLSSGSPISTYMRRRRQKTGSSAMAAQSAVLPAAAVGAGRSLSTTRPVSTFVPETQKNGGLLLADGSSALAKYQTMPSKKLDTQRLSSSTSTSPPLVTVEDRIMRHLKQRLQITHMLSEFAQLPRKRIHKCVCAVAQLPENVHRNAQQLAVPYDDTRIQIARTSENSQGYINATDIILSAPSGSAITTITSSSSTAANTPPSSAASSMSINHSATATMTPPSIAGKHYHFAPNNSNNNPNGQLGITPPYERCYIATQTPLPNTVDDFYHMLWRYDVRIVVQLDGRPEYYCDETNENVVADEDAANSGVKNSVIGNAAVQQHQHHNKLQHPYLPQLHKKQHARTQKAAQYGPFIVKRLSTSHCREGWTTTTLQIECTDPNLLTSSNNVMPQPVNTLNSKSGSRKTTESPRTNSTRHLSATRNLVHFSFNAWPRNSPTAMPDAKSFVMFMREVATFYRDASPTQPPLLHCMNGCGRTGVAILFDFASQCLDREILVDIPRVLNHMRIQRPYMVPHARLYRLCFEALKEHYCSDRLI